MPTYSNRATPIMLMVLAITVIGAGCGQQSSTNSNTTNTSTVTNTPPINSRTTGSFSTKPTTEEELERVTISGSGVDRPSITVSLGDRVEFRNADEVRHFIASDPHPTHTDLPGFEQDIAAGGNYIFTFARRGTFRYHDHNLPNDASFKGTIIVQ